MKEKVVIVAAHPDDEILGCGGTIVKHIKKGDKVSSIILSKGVTSRYDKETKKLKISNYKKKLNTETIKANKVIGVKNIFIEDLPDNNFDSVNLLDIIKILEKYFKKIKPTVIYTHSNVDLNIDHQIVFRAVITASRPKPLNTIKKIFSFEIPSSTDWSFGHNTKNFSPNYFVNIEKEINKKLKALKQYKSEMTKFPNSRSLENIKNLSLVRGSTVGFKAAEAFEIVRYLKK